MSERGDHLTWTDELPDAHSPGSEAAVRCGKRDGRGRTLSVHGLRFPHQLRAAGTAAVRHGAAMVRCGKKWNGRMGPIRCVGAQRAVGPGIRPGRMRSIAAVAVFG